MKKGVFALFILIAILAAPAAFAYGVTFYNPAWNPQDGMIFDVIEPDVEYTFNVRIVDISVTKIVFTVEREADNGGITIYNLKTLPKGLPEIDENKTYEVDELKYSGFVPHEMGDVTYEFKVAKEWLESKSVPRNHVVLHYYDRMTGDWEPLDTEIIAENSEYVYFISDYAGVHYLMIGESLSEEVSSSVSSDMSVDEELEAKPPEEPADEPEHVAAPVDETAAEVLDVVSEVEDVDLEEEVVVEEASLPTTVSEPVEVRTEPVSPGTVKAAEEKEDNGEDSGSRLTVILIIVSLGAIGVIIYLVFGDKGSGSVDKELNNYIAESLKRGKSKEDIRSRLLEVGWHPERVDKALSKHKEQKHALHHKQAESTHAGAKKK